MIETIPTEGRRLMTSVLEAALPAPALLQRQPPQRHGVDPAALVRLAGRLAEPGLSVDSLMVLRHGAVLYERWWRDHSPERTHPVYSVTESFTATAVGMAVDEGLLAIDEPVLAFFPTYATAAVRANIGQMTLRDLLTMSSGHSAEVGMAVKAQPDEDWIRMFLETPLVAKPGTRFVHNSADTHVLSAALAHRTGQTVAEFLQPRLFDPLGIGTPRWDTDSRGLPHGGRGMWLRTADLAALGQFYLNQGRWRGRQLVSIRWVQQATTPQVRTGRPAEGRDRWKQSYGFQFWTGPGEVFRADGAHGQYAVVHPTRGVVIAVTANTERTDEILDAVHDFLDDCA
jgi:CubicO group peptidase (beta-lactamase class C family)